jgi:ABC-type branched-subunit amino acid transport system ATPase component
VPVEELAAGERRRSMLASALAAHPSVLLLDEPSAGAAPEDVDRLAAILHELRADGLAILLVEHNLGLVERVADRVIALEARA